MIDTAFRSRWAWLLGSAAGAAMVIGACSANDPTPSDDDNQGGSQTGGSGGTAGTGLTSGNGGTAPSGGAGPTGGTAGTGAPGGTGSGATGGAATGGAAPTGGSAGAGGTAGSTSGAGPGGTAGAGGSAPATLVEPIARGGNYVLEFGDLYFEVNPAGARVVDLHLTGGTNLLTTASVDPDGINYGSTFWPSPQTWQWPPDSGIPQINSGAYAATVASPAVSFVGPTTASLVGATVSKRFTADLAKVAVVVDYRLTATAANKSFAPWEITRFFKRGLTFYPTGSSGPTVAGTFALPPTTNAAGCTWHEAPTANGADQKFRADGSGGWLAHVDGDIVVVKKFADTTAAQAAPNEGEIELFVRGNANYIEVEEQGAYQPVAMGASLDWSVTWIVRRLPQGVTATVGNAQLVQFVQSLVQ